MSEKQKTGRGFASLTPERRRELASKGGKAAQAKGTGHRWNSKEARLAGRKGGLVRQSRAAAGTDVGNDIPGGGAV